MHDQPKTTPTAATTTPPGSPPGIARSVTPPWYKETIIEDYINADGLHVVTAKIDFGRRKRSEVIITPPPPAEPTHRPARVAEMLALGHRIQRALDSGEYQSQAAAAKALGISRMRVTQILNLTFLAPDIQEKILFMEAIDGVEPTTERALREVARHDNWADQRRSWTGLAHTVPSGP